MSVVGSIVEGWRDRREQAALLRALSAMGQDQARMLAADAGMGLEELRDALRRGARSTTLLNRMLQARGLVAAAIDPRTMRDIESTCSRCESRGICRRELDAGTAAEHAVHFCANHRVMSLLQERIAA